MNDDTNWEYEDEQPDSLEQARMSFLEHLAELRRRILYSAVALAVGFGVCWFFKFELFEFLLLPLQRATEDATLAQMHHKDMAETFFTLLKTSLVGAIFLSSPALLYHAWKFVAPGLYPDEKKIVVPFVVLATFFFFVGGAFCYLVVIPFGYSFLMDFSMNISQPMLMINEYFAMTTKLLVGFGVVFELPVVAMFLSAIGVITHHTLLRHWRIAVVGSFVVGAILTPPDVLTQLLMAGPLIILYGISIVIAWVFTRRRERKAAELEASLG